MHHLKPLKEAYPDYIPAGERNPLLLVTMYNPVCALAVNQIELTPYLTYDEVVAYCQKEHIVLEAYCPLAKGWKLQDPLLISIAAK